MSNLVDVSARLLKWAQELPDVTIPAGLETDMREAIDRARALELRHPAVGGDMAVTGKESKPEEPTNKVGGVLSLPGMLQKKNTVCVKCRQRPTIANIHVDSHGHYTCQCGSQAWTAA
jgi:hypothetical protein